MSPAGYARTLRGAIKVHRTYEKQIMSHCGSVDKHTMLTLEPLEVARWLMGHPKAMCHRCFGTVAPKEIRDLMVSAN